MKQLSPENHAATKVIETACTWVDLRRAVQAAPKNDRAREVGLLREGGNELAQAVEKYRKAGGQP